MGPAETTTILRFAYVMTDPVAKQPSPTDLVEHQQAFGANHAIQRKLNHRRSHPSLLSSRKRCVCEAA